MDNVICDTSVLQYLHQIDLLFILPKLVGRVVVPPAVVEELTAGINLGINLPDLTRLDWIEVLAPQPSTVLPMARNLGRGEI